MPEGPKGEWRPADVVGAAVMGEGQQDHASRFRIVRLPVQTTLLSHATGRSRPAAGKSVHASTPMRLSIGPKTAHPT